VKEGVVQRITNSLLVENVVDLDSEEIVENPYPSYDKIRRIGPIAWSQTWNMWLVAGHSEAQSLLRESKLSRIFTDRSPADEWHTFNWLNNRAMLDLEPPDHTRLRQALSPSFKPGAVALLRSQIHSIIMELVDSVQSRLDELGEVDLVGELLAKLPVWVICELLGVPAQDRSQIRIWSDQMVRMFEVKLTPDDIAAGQLASQLLADYFAELVRDRKQTPQDDLITDMIALDDAFVDTKEIVANIILLFNGGTGALINGLGIGLVQMLQEQAIWREFCDGHEILRDTAVEEIFRFEAPLQLFERTAISPLEFGGVTISTGETVGLLLGAANRDPRVFARPNEFDMHRSPNPHLSFSAGHHFCLGAPLARLEARQLLTVLASELPNMSLARSPRREHGLMVRGYESLFISRG
jgi:cytochrome P450